MTPLLAIAGASVLLPLIVFRGRTLAGWMAFVLATWAVALVVWRLADLRDPYFAAIAFGVGTLAVFSIVLAAGKDVRWSAWRAAAVAAVVYALVVPTQMRTPIDGDEPFYLLVTESLVRDHDFDLANQYRDLAHSETGRPDLKPQLGDPVGKHGEQYSRHEPFLPILLIPGYLAAGLPGALATIALFSVLLVRSTVRLMEEEGIDDGTIRAFFPFFAFAPPVIFYVARIWPEIPAALCFVEALRGIRQRRLRRAVPALFFFVMLKLRFVLVGIVLAGAMIRDRVLRIRRVVTSRHAMVAAIVAVPLVAVWLINGHFLNVHSWKELLPYPAAYYWRGACGLLVDGEAGLLFQAPFYLLGLFAFMTLPALPRTLRIGGLAALPYLISLVPRAEWHGGWSPPLRYVVVFMPLLLIAAAELVRRGGAEGPPAAGAAAIGSGTAAFLAPAALWTIGITAHGLAFPWRLFHIENGENPVGEWLSTMYRADFSRLFPSFIRENHAATVAVGGLAIAFLVCRWVRPPAQLVAPLLALLLAAGFVYAQKPADIVEFEDAHVVHDGGELYPDLYTVARFFYRSGWRLHAGESMTFRAKAGESLLQYACGTETKIELAGRVYSLQPTGDDHFAEPVTIPRDGIVRLRCLEGVVNLDRMTHE